MNYATRLRKLEQTMIPAAVETIHFIHIIVDPAAPGDMITGAVMAEHGSPMREWTRLPQETKAELCARFEREMGLTVSIPISFRPTRPNA